MQHTLQDWLSLRNTSPELKVLGVELARRGMPTPGAHGGPVAVMARTDSLCRELDLTDDELYACAVEGRTADILRLEGRKIGFLKGSPWARMLQRLGHPGKSVAELKADLERETAIDKARAAKRAESAALDEDAPAGAQIAESLAAESEKQDKAERQAKKRKAKSSTMKARRQSKKRDLTPEQNEAGKAAEAEQARKEAESDA